jgi:uncharacterized protein with HEPN domain
MPPEDRVRLLHMVESLEAVERFIAGKTREDLNDNEMLRFALVRALEIVGEAAARVSAPTRKAAPDIPWQQLAGIRNRLVHAYFDVNFDIVWTTSTSSVPDLLPRVQALLDRD